MSPAWLDAAVKDIGFHEIGNNQGIGKFIAQGRCGQPGDPWCAIFVNAKLEESGIRGTRSASSQSFRHDARFVKLAGPAPGAIAVYWRGRPTSGIGHVGFYLGETATQVLTLGGNQSDTVSKQFEPKARLWGYWWPASVPLPTIKSIHVNSVDGHPTGSET